MKLKMITFFASSETTITVYIARAATVHLRINVKCQKQLMKDVIVLSSRLSESHLISVRLFLGSILHPNI